MLAILVVMGTKYACNLDHVGDQICLQSQLQWGPNMPAIVVTMGTKYACNLGYDGDQICLQSWLQQGPIMPAILVTLRTKYACNHKNFQISIFWVQRYEMVSQMSLKKMKKKCFELDLHSQPGNIINSAIE